ncbi:3-hydroxybutyryl-CoA dehydrogenase [Klenkia sp. PcliD-1-E]|uniref:3-hydroxybutyryl-CoA dehydrogenase n=1 Tax=Klenkia sp. PcliD-1-E TaxID=2954492 RepID=UPI00209808B6|nr:3-hydroxybutyryl-CoA dehydrogenase [Klenkia sp. PcliD-1-E]MCO7218224.1 3-hydroxybutyryl-CoA dehydrogenase [Klenkia sp. PcliD-1-E]
MQRIAVIGGGQMGAGIAEVSARAGCDVVVVEADEAGAERFRARLEKSLARAAKSGRLSTEDADAALARVDVATSLEGAVHAELVIEAAPEVEALKLDLFRELDELLPPEAVLASNTSSIPLVKMASVTKRPDKVVGVHFFNPAPVLPLVEVVASLLTSDATLAAVTAFAEDQLGKTTIRSKDRAGFIVNALLIPYLLSAIRMMESGFASAEDIDAGMVQGCAHPQGPLALADLIGLDTTAAVAQSMYEEFKEPLYAPPPLLLRMVDAGLLGRKTGRGFFPYER